MRELDPRIVNVGVEVDGNLTMIVGAAVVASGVKYDNCIQNECEVRIANLDKHTRDFILTATSPLNQNRTPKRVVLDVGRVSYGTSRIIVGDIISSSISQPPDIWLTLKALTGNFYNGDLVSVNQGSVSSVAQIAQGVATTLGASLNFQATDKNIASYSFTGAASKQIDKLGLMGNFSAFLDDKTLVVKDKGKPLEGGTKLINMSTGMIGIPELSPFGVKVRFLIDSNTRLGGAITVQSELNPAANGTYCIYKLSFEVASRDTPFYYIAEAYKIG